MPWCGFNEKMLKGLTVLSEGLVEHGLIDRSKKKNQSIEKILENELNDIDRFIKEIPRIEDFEMREISDSLVKYAKAFYKLIRREGVENYKEISKFVTDFHYKMDEKFYNELEGKPDDMRQLALYLNKISKEKK